MRSPFRRRVRRSHRPALVRPTAAEIQLAAENPTPDGRARLLLLSHLNAEQRATYTKSNYIEVVGSGGGRYCLHASPYVYRLDAKGNHINGYCTYVNEPYMDVGRVPRDDKVLTYLLLLQTNEKSFLDIARRMTLRTDERDRLRHARRRVFA